MRKMLKGLSIALIVTMFPSIIYVQISAIKYTDGRFIKNTQVLKYIEKIVKQHEDYKELNDKYLIHPERTCFAFSIVRETNKVRSIGIIVPVAYNGSAVSFHIKLIPKNSLSSIELVDLFLNSDEFTESGFEFKKQVRVIIEEWEPDRENEYDNKYSIMTDITEDNWREKFSDEENIIPDLCPGSLMFFELHPGEKFFVEGYEH